MKKLDLTGQRFGKLIALERLPSSSPNKKRGWWLCQCDCGNTWKTTTDRLTRGVTTSCGCDTKEKIERAKKKINKYTIDGDTTTIYTSRGLGFLVDTEDLDRLLKICWVNHGNGYAVGKNMETGKLVSLHRYILNVSDKKVVVDHINRDTFDNRKNNLRKCTNAENSWNHGIAKSCTSGVSGVSYVKERKKWLARIYYKNELIELGCYEKFQDAVEARHKAEKDLWGEFAPNITQQQEELSNVI